MRRLFPDRSRELQEEIGIYLDCVSKSAQLFNDGVRNYFSGNNEGFESRRLEVSRIEREADECLKKVKYKLYAYMLLPDSRGDVFKLLDTMDDLVDAAKQVLLQLSVEKPEIPEFLRDSFTALGEASYRAVEQLVAGVRAFFSNTKTIEEFVSGVYMYEKEADRLEESIKRRVFSGKEIERLCHKVQIRYFVDKISLLSDKAEDVAKNLLIYNIKRKI
jgi:predicted phosphate transport protein (TIGR00153 family)